MIDYQKYHQTDFEIARTDDLLRILPHNRRTILDIGARDGHFSRLLSRTFEQVTALDLKKPDFSGPNIETIAGDVTDLQFPACSFDCVFCAEVLEHVSEIEKACREIARVAKHEIVIGVPYKQETRLGRTTCRACGKVNPPWGHVNRFDEQRLIDLFPGLSVVQTSFVGAVREATNFLSVALMDFGRNPWGTYSQEEPCIHCGAEITPVPLTLLRRISAGISSRINSAQRSMAGEHPNWIHVVFSKP